jgi:hypothetical protein
VTNPSYVLGNILAAAVMVVAVGCGSPQSAESSPQASSTSTTAVPAPIVASLFDPRWMGVTPSQPNGWEELNRRITADFQQFDFRPVDETDFMRGCNGCAPWTATLTAYAPGKFDPTDARTGRPASVNGNNDGFFRPADDIEDATLTWQYADNAWATAVGMTTATENLDRLVGLARALTPAERIPIRLPMTFANVPANMPLAQIIVDTSPLQDERLDYGTRLEFAPCAMTENYAVPDCFVGSDKLSVRVAPRDYRTPTGGVEHTLIPVKIGGRDGLYDELADEASVQVMPGMLVEFQLTGPSYPTGRAGLDKVLTDLSWAPDPANETTWPPVTDWAK